MTYIMCIILSKLLITKFVLKSNFVYPPKQIETDLFWFLTFVSEIPIKRMSSPKLE